MLFWKAEGLIEIERTWHIKDILYQFYKNPYAQQFSNQLGAMLRAYNLRKSGAKLGDSHAYMPFSFLLPTFFLCFLCMLLLTRAVMCEITPETKSSNLIIFLPESTYYKANKILKTFLVMHRRGTIVF